MVPCTDEQRDWNHVNDISGKILSYLVTRSAHYILLKRNKLNRSAMCEWV